MEFFQSSRSDPYQLFFLTACLLWSLLGVLWFVGDRRAGVKESVAGLRLQVGSAVPVLSVIKNPQGFSCRCEDTGLRMEWVSPAETVRPPGAAPRRQMSHQTHQRCRDSLNRCCVSHDICDNRGHH